jgi:hypothetical protein
MPTLKLLPPELLACILDLIPSIHLQQTTISLLRILSYDSIPSWRKYLFYHVHLKSSKSVLQLYEHLRRVPGDAAFVRKFSLAVWSVDANASIHAVKTILMLPELKWLSLFLGRDFSPKHLARLFLKPMLKLEYLSLQLRP